MGFFRYFVKDETDSFIIAVVSLIAAIVITISIVATIFGHPNCGGCR